jgi:hypothetical protein
MHGNTTGEDIFSDVERQLQQYELPLNEILCLVTEGTPALSGCKNGVLGKLNVKFCRMIPNFDCIIHQEVLCCKVLK